MPKHPSHTASLLFVDVTIVGDKLLLTFIFLFDDLLRFLEADLERDLEDDAFDVFFL